MSKKPLTLDMIAGSQLRDIQGEIFDVEGADISELLAGRGRLNDNHGAGFYNSIGRITGAKKIFKEEDCEDDRHRYFWNKVKAPYLYVKGELYDNEDHPNAKAAAAILRNIHRSDVPLKMKSSVEGGVIARGIADPSVLARTKVHSVALTFTPANTATLVEPLNLDKSVSTSYEKDMLLMKSVLHLVKTDVPTFRQITRTVSAKQILANIDEAKKLAKAHNIDIQFPDITEKDLIQDALIKKIEFNVSKINNFVKSHSSEMKVIKNLEEINTLLKASGKQLHAMMGGDDKAKEVSEWTKKHLDRDDLAQWFARSYKKDPSIFSDENKKALEHFGSQKDLHKEFKNLRLGKEHSFEDGMNHLKDADNKVAERAKNTDTLVEPDKNTKKLMDVGNGYAWYSLGKGSCDKEAKAMGHCGNEPSEEDQDNLLSLRKEKKIGDKTYHEPHLTFVENNGFLGEMKGKGNEKPNPRYHDAIKQLLQSPHAQVIMGGGYEPHKNFQLSDLPEEDRKELLEKKPYLDLTNSLKKMKLSDVPKKHEGDIERHNDRVDTINTAFKQHGSLDNIMKSGNAYQKQTIFEHPMFNDHITPEHLDSILSDKTNSVELKRSAVKHPQMNEKNINTALDDANADVSIRSMAISHPNANEKHIDRVLKNDDSMTVKRHALDNKNVNEKHIDTALNDKDPGVRQYAANHEKINKDQTDKAHKDSDSKVRMTALYSPHTTSEHIANALNDKDIHVQRAAIQHKNITSDHIDQVLSDENSPIKLSAIRRSEANESNIDKALNDEDDRVRMAAASHANATAAHIDKALNDPDHEVRHKAVLNPNATATHIDKALNDKAPYVKLTASEIKEKLNKALTAGYGGASAPMGRTGGSVLQAEEIEYDKPGFKYITCDDCGKEQVAMKNQTKCRSCNKSFSLEKLAPFVNSWKS